MAMAYVLILSGYGINCERETQFAFERAGARADIVHINDLIENPKILDNIQILVIPGGFSYGDDTGAGNALANKIRNHLSEKARRFIEADNLALGICNGFQVITNLGLLPALGRDYGKRVVALVHNDSARYSDRWVDLKFSGRSVWTQRIQRMMLPIAHGEGKFYTDAETLRQLNKKNLIAAKYVNGEICIYQSLPFNPNGSLEDIAGITDESGRVLGMMPHPERAIDFTHLPHWTFLNEKLKREGKDIPKEGPGIQIFKNGVDYFRK